MQIEKNGRRILIGEDEPEVRAYLEMALKCFGYSVEVAEDGEEVINCLRNPKGAIDAVLLDVVMPHKDGLETLREIRSINPAVPVIMISGQPSSANIVTSMKGGAVDFLCKPVTHDELQRVVGRAMEMSHLDNSNAGRGESNREEGAFLGVDPRMREIQSLVPQIAWSEAPILIQGETGSGKEVLARELHRKSPRTDKLFLKLNCAALPSELVESELFGYERGAFTGAFQKKAGMFEIANGGTIFLDEIGDMDFRLQAKLLQVLQDYQFQRIGGKETIRVDVRVIAATHRDLEQAIADRGFREDLYYRLNVLNVHLPPLRERKDDIIPLSKFLMRKYMKTDTAPVPLTAELRHAMLAYNWPGNVRELENTVRRLLILGNPDIVTRELQAKTLSGRPVISAVAPDGEPAAPRGAVEPESILERVTKAKQEAETDAILAALNATRWNRKQAAILLNIDYKALLYKMKKLGIDGKTSMQPPVVERAAFSAHG